ncbi:hypothetical protein B7494_g6196 [Chlorociboria aeruginascens]|nr:hypothetical protein B7494_g6196 [Chlorociboria aeruginascens]
MQLSNDGWTTARFSGNRSQLGGVSPTTTAATTLLFPRPQLLKVSSVTGGTLHALRRARLRPQPSSYSHIQVQASPDSEGDAQIEDTSFVRKYSVQTEIEEKLQCKGKFAPAPPDSPSSRPKTFAEAAMSTTRGRQQSSSKENTGEAVLGGPMTLESLGPFKYTFRKKKKSSKWSPLDLSSSSAADRTSEVDSISEIGSHRAESPNHSPDHLLSHHPHDITTTTTTTTTALQGREPGVDTDPTPTQLHFDQSSLAFLGAHTDPTPTQRDFHPASLLLSSHSIIDSGVGFKTSLDHIDSDISDTQSVKDRTEAAMARLLSSTKPSPVAGGDSFDTVEWDPDLPSAAPDASPEPVAVVPQALAYTTVGSLVNPNIVPQFTAPNRIQREGARRPMISSNSRHHDHYYQSRDPPPPLNMQNSMQYTQQLAHGSSSFGQTPPPSARSMRTSRSAPQMPLSDQEAKILMRLSGMVGPPPVSILTPQTPVKKPLETPTQAYMPKDLLEEDMQSNTQPVQGLEKMQTLQRLAKFQNPMQEHARNRLSEFSVAKSQTSRSSGAWIGTTFHDEHVSTATSIENGGAGNELNRSYRFPPPGLPNPNPLLASTSDSSLRPPPGYPQPLTAGPPGQRQYSNKHSCNENLWSDQEPQISTWPKSSTEIMDFPQSTPSITYPGYIDHTKCHDTLPMAVVSKYYPHGYPSDMTGNYTRLSLDMQKKMGQIPNDDLNLDQKKAKDAEEVKGWFYTGQKRYGMTINEHINDLRDRVDVNHFGPIGRPKADTNIDKEPLTRERIESMSADEAIKPLIDGVFGSLLEYAEDSPTSRKTLSGFIKETPDLVDKNRAGNNSFFGEDWGAPNRFHQSRRNQSSSYDPSRIY